MVLEHFFEYLMGKRHGAKKAMRELEISLRAKDPATPVEDTELYLTTIKGNVVFLFNLAASGTLVWFAARKAPKYFGIPPLDRPLATIYALGCASLFGNMRHYEFYHRSVRDVLEGGEEHVKMELTKIILNNHSTDNSLVEVVKRHFIAENLLSDQHLEQPLFMWRRRNSYVDYTFGERMKESEANNSNDNDEAKSSVNTRIFEEDSLACILGTPNDNMEITKPPEHTGDTVLTRRELQVRRRSHRHQRHRHADKTAVL